MTTEAELLTKFNFAAVYGGHPPRSVKMPELASLVDSVTQKARHVFFGEPHVNGNQLKTYEMLAQNPEIFVAAAKHGVRHFCVEFPPAFQKYIDQYQADEITRDDLHFHLFRDPFWRYISMTLTGDATAQFQRDFIQSVDNARAADMSVHLADVATENPLILPQEVTDLAAMLVKRHAEEKSPLPVTQYINEYCAALPAAEQKRLDDIWNSFQDQRRRDRMDDTAQYEYLRARLPASEGIMGVVGLAHLDGNVDPEKSIAGLLRAEGAEVACIELYDREDARSFTKELYEMWGQAQRSPPDYTVIIDDRSLLDREQQPTQWPAVHI